MTARVCPFTPEGDADGSFECHAPRVPVVVRNADRTQATPADIRVLLARAQLTQQAAADYLGVSARTVRKYLSGENPIPYPSVVVLELLGLERESSGVSESLADQLVTEDEQLLRELAK